MDWLRGSIMDRRGVAKGAVGHTHRLTEAEQGEYRYTIGRYADPVLTVRPGDRIAVETVDAFGGVIESESDRPSAKLEMPFVNPQNGPVVIEGAAKGDVLGVPTCALRSMRLLMPLSCVSGPPSNVFAKEQCARPLST